MQWIRSNTLALIYRVFTGTADCRAGSDDRQRPREFLDAPDARRHGCGAEEVPSIRDRMSSTRSSQCEPMEKSVFLLEIASKIGNNIAEILFRPQKN